MNDIDKFCSILLIEDICLSLDSIDIESLIAVMSVYPILTYLYTDSTKKMYVHFRKGAIYIKHVYISSMKIVIQFSFEAVSIHFWEGLFLSLSLFTYIYIYIYISKSANIIDSLDLLLIQPYWSLFLVCPLHDIQCLNRDYVCNSLLVDQNLVHV